MIEIITLDILTQDSVSLKKQKYIVQNDIKYTVGQPWKRGYMNSTQGREQVQTEVPEPYRSAIFTVWGDTPTVADNTEE